MAIAGVTRGGDFTASVAVGLTPKAAQLGLLAVVCCAVVGGVFATGAGAEAHAVGLAGPVPAGGEDVARRLVAQLVEVARETLLEVAAHLLQNPALGPDCAEPQRDECRLGD